MKKILACLIFSCWSQAFAAQEIVLCNKGGLPREMPWSSSNKLDIVTLRSAHAYCRVLIAIHPFNSHGVGINIEHCAPYTHVTGNAIAICTLSPENPVISFASDADKRVYGLLYN